MDGTTDKEAEIQRAHEEVHRKHPFTNKLIQQAAEGMVGLVKIGPGAPAPVQDIILDALADLQQLTMFAENALHEAGEECLVRIEDNTKKMYADLQKAVEEQQRADGDVNAGRVLQAMLGTQRDASRAARNRDVGFIAHKGGNDHHSDPRH